MFEEKYYTYRQLYPNKKQSSYWETESLPAGQEMESITVSIGDRQVSSLGFSSSIPTHYLLLKIRLNEQQTFSIFNLR
jgi:hypothetical protein